MKDRRIIITKAMLPMDRLTVVWGLTDVQSWRTSTFEISDKEIMECKSGREFAQLWNSRYEALIEELNRIAP